jgi:hypothetical protein
VRILGFLVFLIGLALLAASYNADAIGVGQFEGVGENQILLGVLGLIVAGGGLLMMIVQRDARARRAPGVGPGAGHVVRARRRW